MHDFCHKTPKIEVLYEITFSIIPLVNFIEAMQYCPCFVQEKHIEGPQNVMEWRE